MNNQDVAVPRILCLSTNQEELYWQAVGIMEQVMLEKWKHVSALYSRKDYIPRTRVALINQRVIAGLIWRFARADRSFEIYSMAVSPELQRTGIGRRLIEDFEDYTRGCIQQGAEIDSLILDAQGDNWRFYNKLGFDFTQPRINPDAISGPIEMKKRLCAA